MTKKRSNRSNRKVSRKSVRKSSRKMSLGSVIIISFAVIIALALIFVIINNQLGLVKEIAFSPELSAQDAPVGTGLSNCTTINESGNYYLSNNLTAEGDCLVITADNVVLDGQGFTITGDGSGKGIGIIGHSNVTIKNIDVEGFQRGIYLGSKDEYGSYNGPSSNNVFLNVKVSSNTLVGMTIQFSSNNIIYDANISNNNYNLDLYSSNNNLLTNVEASNSMRGLYVGYSDNNSFTNLTTNFNQYGLALDSASNSIFNGISLTNSNADVFCYDSNPNIDGGLTYKIQRGCDSWIGAPFSLAPGGISSCGLINRPGYYYLTNDINATGDCIIIQADNVVLDGQGYNLAGSSPGAGIYLSSSNKVSLFNVIISNFSSGIYLDHSSNNHLSNIQTLFSNWNGIEISYSSNNNELSDMVVSSGKADGLYIGYSSNNTLSNIQTFSNNYYGLEIGYSSNNTLSNITLLGNKRGIRMWESSNNTLSNIIASGNNEEGISIESRFVSTANALVNISTFNNSRDGLYLQNIGNSVFEGIVANGNGGNGIIIYISNNNTFNKILAVGNSQNGITESGGGGNSFSDVRAYLNYDSSRIIEGSHYYDGDGEVGLALGDSMENLISDIYSNCNSYGLGTDELSNSSFSNINLNSNLFYGLYLSSSSNNSFYNLTASYYSGNSNCLDNECDSAGFMMFAGAETDMTSNFDHVSITNNLNVPAIFFSTLCSFSPPNSTTCPFGTAFMSNFKIESNGLEFIGLGIEGPYTKNYSFNISYGSGYLGDNNPVDCDALREKYDSGGFDLSFWDVKTTTGTGTDTDTGTKRGGGGGGGGGDVVTHDQTNGTGQNYVPFNDTTVVNQSNDGANGLGGSDNEVKGGNGWIIWVYVIAGLVIVLAVLITVYLVRANRGSGGVVENTDGNKRFSGNSYVN